ncbi:ABC transporter permease [Bifidobacterium aesculapii]|uniref:ABC transporter permease n=1 Tax=Bifidobacterium aesculapii TaxID=1329411 RepID=UPI000A60D7DA|nr:ABC transporter permease [Bifidobacterium aesculapii]
MPSAFRAYGRYAVRKLGSTVFVLVVLSLIVFLMVRLVPGDPLAGYYDTQGIPSDTKIAALRAQLGLDKPWPVQYASWFGALLHGDFGDSLTQPYSVGSQIAKRLPYSIELSVLSTLIALAIAIPFGLVAGRREGAWQDAVIRACSFFAIAMPSFVIGLAIVLTNSRTLRLRLVGAVSFAQDPFDNLRLMLAPALVLAFPFAAELIRYLRANVIEDLKRPYAVTLRAKGLTRGQMVSGHSLRNSLIPLSTVVGLHLAALVGGTVVIENVFSIPGMGQFLIQSINAADYPSVQGAVFVIGVIFIAMNLVIELLYPVINPRIGEV